MKKRNRFLTALSGIVMACLFLLPISVTDIKAAEYEVVFKAGAHGSVDGQKEVSYRLSTSDVFPDEPTVLAEEGYVFKGWSKQLPSVGSKVTGKQVYVAKYGVMIDGVSYTVRYVDENKTDIATPKTMLGERGTQINERAKTVPGYTYQQAEQSFTLNDGMEIQFVYTLTNPNEVIRYETVEQEEVVNQVVQQENNNQNNVTPTPNPNPTPAPNPDVVIPDNNQPQGDGDQDKENETDKDKDQTDIDDQKTPEGDGKNNDYTLLAGGLGILVVAGIGIIFLYWNKKRKTEEANS